MTNTVHGSTMWKNQTQPRIGVLSKLQGEKPKYPSGGHSFGVATIQPVVIIQPGRGIIKTLPEAQQTQGIDSFNLSYLSS